MHMSEGIKLQRSKASSNGLARLLRIAGGGVITIDKPVIRVKLNPVAVSSTEQFVDPER